MLARHRLFLYQFVWEESQQPIVAARDVEGFFCDVESVSSSLRLVDAEWADGVRGDSFQEVEMQVLDANSEAMASYYLRELDVLGSSGDGENLMLDVTGYSLPFPYAGVIWRRWARSRPRSVGEWKELGVDSYESWLHVVQTAWFEAGRRAMRYTNTSPYVLEGRDLGTMAGFYCALGEVINGPGGYFGANLAGLDDCLSAHGPNGNGDTFQLVWHDYADSRQQLGRDEVEGMVRVLRERGVDLCLQE
ncbi:barstar family protein [Streptomyces sp. PTM05]|uniref:Barstar family protein n=1 Tax=Streptantibioticus parmotrematis TaxID=2873249 RepID=A0ABS7QSQ1_9ACTN|nr:barstar family protein [Streptantibioticus parmotrematis]MBY8886210.1 barstar family protein [Streptantibioticus parmotrematis]